MVFIKLNLLFVPGSFSRYFCIYLLLVIFFKDCYNISKMNSSKMNQIKEDE